MHEWVFERCRVVDIARQLQAIDPEVMEATSLLPPAGSGYPPGLFQQRPLSRTAVLFFKPEVATVAGFAEDS